MRHLLFRFHAHAHLWRHMVPYEALAILLIMVFVAVAPTAALRFQERSLYMTSVEPGDTTSYTVSLRYMSPDPVGSLELLFCVDPIPYHPCVTPPGLNLSGVTLGTQTGEGGFASQVVAPNRIVLARSPTAITSTTPSSYVLNNVVNPTDTSTAFSIRMKSHASTNATGSQIDFGSVRGQVVEGIVIQTQVPPMLIFCLAGEVAPDCGSTNEEYFTDMGELGPSSTLTAQSQMAVGTNASGGFAITANGSPPAAGTSVINAPTVPTVSQPGTNQFGINLVANNSPVVGSDPEGTWANAIASPDYGTPNQYKYVPGDVVAFSPNVSLMKKFTVSYILNSSPSLRAGVYSTTITYIASGRF